MRCSFKSCCLCSCVILLILLLSGASCGSLGFCFWVVFLLSMDALMFSLKSLFLLRILPWSISCLSAASIAFVCILFPWCASGGSSVFVSVCSISFVKSSQFVFL